MTSESPRRGTTRATLRAVPLPPACGPMASYCGTAWALKRLAAFFVLVGLLAFALDAAIIAGVRRITTSSFGASNRIVNGTINADVVISGSSRALVHYDPRVIREVTGLSAFNLGRNGSQTDLQLAVLRTYLAHNTVPRLVVHNLDLYSFLSSHEIYDPAQYVPYLNEPAIFTAVQRVYPDAWKWKHVPLYGYLVHDMRFTWLAGLKAHIGLHPREDHIDGFVPRNLSWTEDFEHFRRANPDGVRVGVERRGIRDLEELAELCRARDIPLVFAYSPEYFEVHALQLDRARIFGRFAELSARFGAQLWDFSDSPLSRDRNNFYNSQHLNARGAARFSHEFSRRLVDSRVVSQMTVPH